MNGFNLPSHKSDVNRPQNIMWLINNLHVKNANHPKYKETMRDLIAKAKAQNLIGESEVKRRLHELDRTQADSLPA